MLLISVNTINLNNRGGKNHTHSAFNIITKIEIMFITDLNRKVNLVCLIALSGSIAFAQNPLVKQWDYRFGGDWVDNMAAFQETADGGYILGGFSSSDANGNKSQPPQGNVDYWIVKIDDLGIQQWDARYGGTDADQLTCLQQTTDGGYILGGTTYSGIGGDVSQDSVAGADYWIVKTDANGTKLWDSRFGGTSDDELRCLQQTADGGYILGGFSNSPAGADKSQSNQGPYYTSDFWIVKTDSMGVKEWDKRFGGNDNDGCFSIKQTNDSGYILAVLSLSEMNGHKKYPSNGASDS